MSGDAKEGLAAWAGSAFRHCCGRCAHGYLNHASKDNPAKTDYCVICGHNGEGINWDVRRNKFGRLKAVWPNAPAQPRREEGGR